MLSLPFTILLQPDYCVRLDVGIKARMRSLSSFFTQFEESKQIVDVCGRIATRASGNNVLGTLLLNPLQAFAEDIVLGPGGTFAVLDRREYVICTKGQKGWRQQFADERLSLCLVSVSQMLCHWVCSPMTLAIGNALCAQVVSTVGWCSNTSLNEDRQHWGNLQLYHKSTSNITFRIGLDWMHSCWSCSRPTRKNNMRWILPTPMDGH